MRLFVLAIVLLLPATAAALDCTPFQSWTCTQQGYYDLLDGVPGEVLCGVDYTGWTLHVVEVTVAQAGWIRFSGISASSSGNIVDTAIMLMDDCAAGTCLASVQGNHMTDLDTCLDVGTHTFVVASNTTAPTAFMNIGIMCPTCEDAGVYGFECIYCGTIDSAGSTWGSVKARFE